MMVSIWLIYKKGEPRVYTTSLQPPDDQADRFRKDGFKIYRAEVWVPTEDDTIVDSVIFVEADGITEVGGDHARNQ